MKKVAVVGGAGFIGSNLVDKLLEKNLEVIVIDNLSTGKLENINEKATFINLDIYENEDKEIANALEGVDVVFHTAALARVQPSIIDPVYFDKINSNGTVNLLKACVDAGVKRVVYSASSSCYGDATIFPTPESHPTNPLSPYGLQKYIGEQYCKMFSQVYDIDTVNIGNGDNFSVNEIADIFGGEKSYGIEVLEPFQTLADNSKAKEVLGWNPKGNLERWLKSYLEKIS